MILLTLLTFPLWEAKNASGREMLIMLIMLNPLPEFPESPKHELTLLTFPLPEAFFLGGELTLLTFLAFWLKCRVANARKPYKNRVFEHVLCEKDANTGAVPFSDLRSQKKGQISVHKIVSRKMALF